MNSELVSYISSTFMSMMMCIVRLAATLSLLPSFSKQFVVGMGRGVIIFGMALPLYYLVYPTLPKAEHLPLWVFIATICKEAVIGMLLGFLGGFIFFVADSVGFIIDIQRGSSMATTFDPVAGSQTSLLGSMLVQMLTVSFFMLGGFSFFINLVYKTYVMWPVFGFYPKFDSNFSSFFLALADEMMEVIFCLAGPILIVLFLAEFGLGMISRFAPQLNVFFLAMPIKSWLSMFFLLFYFSLLIKLFKYYFYSQGKLSSFINKFFK